MTESHRTQCATPLQDGQCTCCLLGYALGDERRLLAGLADDGALFGDGLGAFGDYEIECEIARGGMGVVYRARASFRSIGLSR